MISSRGFPVLVVALVVAAVLSVGLAVCVGAVAISVELVGSVLLDHMLRRASSVSGVDEEIVWNLRLPRVLLAFVAGAGLSVAGVTLQAVVRNPLADPYVLGVSSGASLGAVAALTMGATWLGGLGVSVAAFVGALFALAVVLLLARREGTLSPLRVVLAGTAIGYLFAAATSYLQLRAHPSELAGVLFWLLGSVSGAQWHDLAGPAVAVVACVGYLSLQGRALNALLFGDETATTLGIGVDSLRLQLLVLASLLTGLVIAVAGGVGFVGLLVPHAVRLLIGSDHRRVLPVAALLGGTFLVLVDLAARTLDAPNELPLGILTAVLGAPFFLWLLRRRPAGEGGV